MKVDRLTRTFSWLLITLGPAFTIVLNFVLFGRNYHSSLRIFLLATAVHTFNHFVVKPHSYRVKQLVTEKNRGKAQPRPENDSSNTFFSDYRGFCDGDIFWISLGWISRLYIEDGKL